MNLRRSLIDIITNPPKSNLISLKPNPVMQLHALQKLTTAELQDLLFERFKPELEATGVMGPMFIHFSCREFKDWLDKSA